MKKLSYEIGERVAIATAFLSAAAFIATAMSFITDVINNLWWGIE